MRTISEQRCFGGTVGFYAVPSAMLGLETRFAVFTPPQAAGGKVPVLTYLAGLTCTEETFMIKAGAQRLVAELGIMLVAPDTSPRGAGISGEDKDWDFGVGAGFYVDATAAPWSRHYRMYSFVIEELPAIIARHFPALPDRQSIFGHSMGGHGALVCALRNPGRYCSVSAFAPIVAASQVPWGQKAFTGYLGPERGKWLDYDATALVAHRQFSGKILIDQGLADKFLAQELRPELFEGACRKSGQKLLLRRHEGYDHSYYFIASFVEDHLKHHARALLG
jgi:S-formylglutathione hydrolase